MRVCGQNDDDDASFQKFNEADIDEILQSSSTKVTYENESQGGSVFSKGTHTQGLYPRTSAAL